MSTANNHAKKANKAAGAVSPEDRARYEAARQPLEKRKVPPELDPAVFAHRVGFEDGEDWSDERDEVLRDARAAYTQLHAVTDEIHEREKTIREDTSRPPAEHALRVSKLADQALQTPGKRLDGARKRAVDAMQEIDDTITRAFRTQMPAEEQREVREHVKALGPKQRREFLAKADDDTISAVLASKPYLSGLSANEQAKLRDETVKRRFPDQVKRRAKLERAVQQLEAGWARYMSHVSSLRDQKADKLQKQRDAADTAATAPINVE
jgi:hypothetical protein